MNKFLYLALFGLDFKGAWNDPRDPLKLAPCCMESAVTRAAIRRVPREVRPSLP